MRNYNDWTKKTPYEYGVFNTCLFPSDYPRYGAKFRFINKVYHLNVYQNIHENNFGRINLNRLNEWRDTGRVTGFSYYTTKRALFAIFCSFYNQNTDCAYDVYMAELYWKNRHDFDVNVRKWIELYIRY